MTAIHRIALRRTIRILLLQALSIPIEAVANLIPFLGEAADVIMVAQLAETLIEFRQLDIDTRAALDFLDNGPYSLDDLKVSDQSQSFSSYEEFYKDFSFEEFLSKRFGNAGVGYQYHHIVEQGGVNTTTLPVQALQNTDNIVRIPTLLHEAINSEYSRRSPRAPRLTVRRLLGTQPYSIQREEGIRFMRELGIIK